MREKEILKFCIEKGFFLDRAMLDFFINLEKEKMIEIINKLKLLGISDKILTKNIFNKYKKKISCCFNNEHVKGENNIKVLKHININSGKIEANDFINYFRVRFEELRDILINKGLRDNFSSIRRIGGNNGVYSIIGMVFSKRITKNKNLLIEIEDLTGRAVVLINRENKELFERAQSLLLDDIVAFNVSGSSRMLFVSDFIYPDSKLESERFGNRDEFVAFSGDLHVGSKMFLEGNLMRFVNWLNGEVGDSRQRELARKVKYLVLSGDNIEGVGVYPGQERSLAIKGCRGQYEKLAEVLGKIRKDIEIIMCPGQHDAVWIGEPQPSIMKKWGGSLNELSNLKMVSNPAVIEIGGLKVMVYYGGSLNKFIDEIPRGRRSEVGGRRSVEVVEEILKKRHLAPIYGEMDIVPNKEGDDLVLGDLPDVFVVGGQHRAMVGNYNNILTILTSCWQSRTDFEEKVGSEPDPCKVPILNLKSKEIKILDFSDVEVRWEKGDDLVCEFNSSKSKIQNPGIGSVVGK